jgi:DNA-binding Lrp family transcriptional regulator
LEPCWGGAVFQKEACFVYARFFPLGEKKSTRTGGEGVMPRALVFINATSDGAEVVESLRKVEGVSEAHSSRGMYDAVALIQAESFGAVKEIVSKRIRGLDNIKSTLTLTLIESQST